MSLCVRNRLVSSANMIGSNKCDVFLAHVPTVKIVVALVLNLAEHNTQLFLVLYFRHYLFE